MAKLTNKGRFTVIAILAILIFGGIYFYKGSDATIDTQKTASTETSTATTDALVSTTESAHHVNVEVDRPVDGVKKGVVEVGASGFNAFVVSIDKNKNWELISKEFGASLAFEGFATTDDVKKGLKEYLVSITNKGVSGRNAHFVISSGALKNPKTELIADAIKQMGYVVNKVTAEQEGKYALQALLPKKYKDNSYVVDIGSGNTKVSWYEGVNLRTIEAPGAKYYQIEGMTDEKAYQEIAAAISQIPQNKRENCFVIGGVPFTLAKQTRQNDERYTTLQSPDSYSAGDDVKVKSGLNIYRAIQETSKTENFIFDWDANFTIGFLMSLN